MDERFAGILENLMYPRRTLEWLREGSGKCLDKCQIFIENKQQQQEKTNKQINTTDKQDAKRTHVRDGQMNEKKATNAFPRKRNKMKERTRKLTRTEDVWTCISAPLPELDLKAVPGAGCRGILRVYWLLPLGCCIVRWVLQKLLTDVPRRS